MALMSKPTRDPKLTRWWWRTLREWVYELVDPLWGAFRGENTDEITLANVTDINGVSTAELATLDGITTTTVELNKLSGLTADATDLNKADRAAADGAAEASRNVVLDANKDSFGKRFDINQSLLEAIAGKSHLWFDGLDDYVEVPDDANLDFGTSDFSILCMFKTLTTSFGTLAAKRKISGSYEGYSLLLNTSGKLVFTLFNSPNGISLETPDAYNDGKIHVVVGVVDRDSSTKLFVDGVETASGGATANVDVDNTEALMIGSLGTDRFKGDIHEVIVFNRVLSADEIKALSSGAHKDFADVGANQTDRVTNGDAWTGASGSTPPNSWSDSGSGTAGYSIRDNTGVANMDSATLELAVIGSGSKTLYQTILQPGKRYRVTFAYRNLDGNSSTIVALGTSANSVTLQNTGISGDGVLFEQELVADGTNILFVVDVDGILQIDNVQVVQTGCVAEYRPDGITAAQWQDTGGNDLHGTVTGAVPLNLPSNHVARYVKTSITGDTVLTEVVPAGYRVKSIIVKETAGNAITGGLKIGSSAGGTQLVNAQAVPANAQAVDCTLGTRMWSTVNPQTLYVEDVTSWNSASIDLWIMMERVS